MRKMNTASSTAASVAGASAESTSTKCRVVLAPRRAQNRGVAWTAAAAPFAPRTRATYSSATRATAASSGASAFIARIRSSSKVAATRISAVRAAGGRSARTKGTAK